MGVGLFGSLWSSLCRVVAHGKEVGFAVCWHTATTWLWGLYRQFCHVAAHGKEIGFAMCSHTAKTQVVGPTCRQVAVGPIIEICRAPRYLAHGKELSAMKAGTVCSLPCAAHGKDFAVRLSGFAVCFRHTANILFPIVYWFECQNSRILILRLNANISVWMFRNSEPKLDIELECQILFGWSK